MKSLISKHRNMTDDVQTFLRQENPGFAVDQITLVMEVFGGYSKNLPTNIGKVFDKDVTSQIVENMQKAVISNDIVQLNAHNQYSCIVDLLTH